MCIRDSKVIKRSEPVRREKVGAFEIDAIASSFFHMNDGERMGAYARFRVRYKGQPVPSVQMLDSVAVVGRGTTATSTPAANDGRTALFVSRSDTDNGDDASDGNAPPCALVIDDGAAARVENVKGCPSRPSVQLVTSDVARFEAVKALELRPGWIDRESMAEPGLYRAGSRAVIDTRTLTAAEVDQPENANPDSSVPALGLSPDERSFVWLAYATSDTRKIVVTNWQANRSYVLPIDEARMRYPAISWLDPAWLMHHFEWTRGADGVDVLRERPAFTVLPYRGQLALAKRGSIQAYVLRFGGEPLRAAIVELLVKEMAGERLPDEAYAYRHRVKVQGKIVNVAVLGTPEYVSVSMEGEDGDPDAMSAIAAKLDAALATGKYDALFVVPPAPTQ